MDFLANYYVKSNFLPIANCIGNRIGEGEDYTCDNSVTKNFLDKAAGEPYNLFQTVEQYKNENKKLKEKSCNYNDLYNCMALNGVEGEECKNADFKKFLDKVNENPLSFNNRVRQLQDMHLKLRDEHLELKRKCGKDTFINIPKKSNGLMYVIFFIIALVLFRKLKK